MLEKIIRHIAVLLVLPVLLLGAAITLYPSINSIVAGKNMESNAEFFMGEMELQPTEISPNVTEQPEREYAKLWDEMVAYNEALIADSQAELSERQFYRKQTFWLQDYGTENEMFGVINIPKLELTMPIYLGATDDNLIAGAAHLSGTSLPIGGNNTCTVIAGHRGWNGAAYFRYVPDLQMGDSVRITNLWENLNYTVVDTQIIAPDDVDSIRIQPDRELLILLTCHPYASGGKQRFLVICERVAEKGGNYEGSNH